MKSNLVILFALTIAIFTIMYQMTDVFVVKKDIADGIGCEAYGVLDRSENDGPLLCPLDANGIPMVKEMSSSGIDDVCGSLKEGEMEQLWGCLIPENNSEVMIPYSVSLQKSTYWHMACHCTAGTLHVSDRDQ